MRVDASCTHGEDDDDDSGDDVGNDLSCYSPSLVGASGLSSQSRSLARIGL